MDGSAWDRTPRRGRGSAAPRPWDPTTGFPAGSGSGHARLTPGAGSQWRPRYPRRAGDGTKAGPTRRGHDERKTAELPSAGILTQAAQPAHPGWKEGSVRVEPRLVAPDQ